MKTTVWDFWGANRFSEVPNNSIIMKKDLLVRFITKYRMNGIVNDAVWAVSDGTLRVAGIGWRRKLFAAVRCRDFHDFDDTEIGIVDTRKLLRMVKAIPATDVSLRAVKYSCGDVAVLMLDGGIMRVEYIATNPENIGVPKMKNIPAWNAAIILDDDFKARFFKACSAAGGKETLFTVAMSERTGKLQVIVRHTADGASGGMCLLPKAPVNMNIVKAPISFSAHCLGEALKANPEFKEPLLLVSDAGLATIKYSADDLESQYYFVQVDVEQ